MKNGVNICFSTDNNYSRHCIAAINSIISNNDKDEHLKFYILDGGIGPQDLDKMQKLINNAGFEVKFIKINDEKFDNINQIEYFTKSAWHRLILGDLINDVDKLIYLDCDLIVLKPLKELYQIDIEGFYLGAIEDVNGEKYTYKKGEKYFNSGVLLINLKKWREDALSGKLLDEANKTTNTKEGLDQNVLNRLCLGKVKFLDLKYNVQYCKGFIFTTYKDLAEYKDAINNPTIVHFVGVYKPWKPGYGFCSPFSKLYFKYSNKSQNVLQDLFFSYRAIAHFIKIYPFFFLKKKFYTSLLIGDINV